MSTETTLSPQHGATSEASPSPNEFPTDEERADDESWRRRGWIVKRHGHSVARTLPEEVFRKQAAWLFPDDE